jgi:hypothetical protein
MLYRTQISDAVRLGVNSPQECDSIFTHAHKKKCPFFTMDKVAFLVNITVHSGWNIEGRRN